MKLELLKKLTESGQVSSFRVSPLWAEAFDLYKTNTGDLRVSTKCSSCYRKVLTWLKK